MTEPNTDGLISSPILAERLGLSRPITPEESHAPAMARGALCTRCTLYGARRGPVLGKIVPNCKLAAGGEAPGKHEMEHGEVFYGWSGDRLTEGLAYGGINRDHITVINAIGCFPPGSFEDYHRQAALLPEVKSGEKLLPAEACYPRFVRDLDESNSKVLLAIGKAALVAMSKYVGIPFGAAKRNKRAAEIELTDAETGERDTARALAITTQHMAPIPLRDGRVLIASLHPAFASKGARSWLPWIAGPQGAFARAARITNRDGVLDWAPIDHAYIFPDIETVESVCRRFAHEKAPVTIDVETDSADVHDARLRLVGLRARLSDGEHAIGVPLRWRDGRWYWPDRQTRKRAEAAILLVLTSCPYWVGHNLSYDTSVMRDEGIWLPSLDRHLWFCTMIADLAAGGNDLPHDLGSATVRRFEVRLWKGDVDHKAAAGVDTDRDLHTYNVIGDLPATGRLAEAQVDEITAHGAWKSLGVDLRLAPVFRDMGSGGLPVDEHRRGELSRILNGAVVELAQKVKACVGRADFNPRSTHQLAAWLYGPKSSGGMELLPPINTKGLPWTDGESPSTGIPAITRLLDRGGLPAGVNDALEALIQYKYTDKARGTYVDKLPVRALPPSEMLDFASSGFGALADPVVKASVTSDVAEGDDEDEEGEPQERKPEDLTLPLRPGCSWLRWVYKQHVTPSGRTAAPYVQSTPKRSVKKLDLRSQYVAWPDHVLVRADMKQVESRIYAVEAQDRLLLKAFADGIDVHTWTFAIINSPPGAPETTIRSLYEQYEAMKPPKDFEDRKARLGPKHPDIIKIEEASALLEFWRTAAKRVRHGVTYGMDGQKMFDTMYNERDKATGIRLFKNLKRYDVERWLTRLHEAEPEMEEWSLAIDRELRDNNCIREGFHGRARWFKGGADKQFAPRNMKIQARAAAYKNEALLRLDEAIPHGKWSRHTGAVTDIHDDLGVFVPESRADETIDILEKCMTFDFEGMPIIPDKPVAVKRLGKLN